ncbi:MAG: hypothetical protein BGO40_06125 [Chryseobacterium sp. 39-10]|nr:helix-turn-helix domain-containing protein [Chryseobacterium sp.]OJV47790.1 MAG: hypothetical protein BGO40_06125 [Chryseobacterium sp. 39-10]
MSLFKHSHYFFFIIFSIFPSILFSQNYPEPNFSKKFNQKLNEKFDTKYFTYEKQFELGKQLLKLSHSDAEFARSYGNMGYAKYQLLKYSEAIPLMEKAKQYAQKSNYVLFLFGMNITLKDAYKKIGFHKKSDECWEEAQNIAKKYNDDKLLFSVYNVFATDFENVGKYDDAITYHKKNLELIKDDQKNILTAASINSSIAYDYLKGNQIEQAKSYLIKATPIIENKENTHKIQELEIYYLAKALFAYQKHDKNEAKNYFKLGLDEAKRRNDKEKFVLITEELLKTDINFSNSKLIFETYIDSQNTKAGEIGKVVGKDEYHKTELIKRSKSYISSLLISIFIIAVLSSILIYFYKRKNQRLKEKIDQIVADFNNKHITNAQSIQNNSTFIDNKPTEIRKTISISTETEQYLLQKIEQFEKGNDFTEKSFTMAKMAALMDSNAMHINYVLQKYRGKTFTDYINELKINYIVRLLINNPQYLNYKISYLSDIAGFSNHSRFTQIFKKELGVSPSEFISGLEAKNTTNS